MRSHFCLCLLVAALPLVIGACTTDQQGGGTAAIATTTASIARTPLQPSPTATNTPTLEGFAVHFTLRPRIQRQFHFYVRCADDLPNRFGHPTGGKATEISDNLWSYRESVEPVTLTDIDGNEHKVQIKDPFVDTFITKEHGRSIERVFEVVAIKVD